MKKVDEMIKHFPYSYDALYPDFDHSAVPAARLIAHDILFLNVKDADYYLKNFFSYHAENFGVYNIVLDKKDSVRRYLQIIVENFPVLSNHINSKVFNYLADADDIFIDRIISFCEKNRYPDRLLSFAEIHKNPENNISENTLKTYIKKLGIEVQVKGSDNTKGKYITESDLQRILQAKNG